MMLNMDPPEHSRLRRILQPIFTPRAVQRLHESVSQNASEVVDDLVRAGGGDLVTTVSAELPLRVLADLLGMPREDRHLIFEWSNALIGFDNPGRRPARVRGDRSHRRPPGVRTGDRGRPSGHAPRRHREPDRPCRGRRRTARRHRVRHVLAAARHRRERDDAERAVGFGPRALRARALGTAGRDVDRDATSCRPRSTSCCASCRRSSTSGARRRSTRCSATSTSVPGTRWSSGTARPTATPRCSTTPTSSIWPATPTRTWRSASVRTSASAPTSPASSSARHSRLLLERAPGLSLDGAPSRVASNFINGISALPVTL